MPVDKTGERLIRAVLPGLLSVLSEVGPHVGGSVTEPKEGPPT